MAKSFAVNTLLVILAMTPFAVGADDAGKPTTVSLTASVYAKSTAADRELVASLLPMLEINVASRPAFSVVERRQIDLVLLELALSKGLAENSNARLQLGKIASADLIVTLKLLEADSAKQPPSDGNTRRDNTSSATDYGPQQRVLVRIVESLTGVIRGVAVVTIDDAQLDETATQIADYLTLIEAQPERPPVTVAVAPFESLGRFDRLRPLELGLRDMVATRLRLWNDRLTRGESETDDRTNEATDTNNSAPQGFRVLQRSNMQELLREFDLIQSALVDRNRLPKTLPTRAAAFLIRGTVDEKNDGGVFRVVVTGELIHAASSRAVRDFQFETKPDGLEAALAHQVDQFAGRLGSSSDEVSEKPGTLRERNEVDLLFGKVASDLRRLRRIRPIDFSYREFDLPGRWRASGPQILDVDSPLRRAILRKSIDRLESTLFLRPDQASAAFSLGFCYSFHIPGIWKPERADEMLRRAAASEDEELRAVSLRLLAEISFHHRSGEIPDGQHDRAAEQLLYAFKKMPLKFRNHLWSRLPTTLESFAWKLKEKDRVLKMLDAASAEAERPDGKYSYELALAVRSLVGLGANRDRPIEEQLALLQRWAEGDQPNLKRVAAWTLGQRAEIKRDYQAAAKWFQIAADAVKSASTNKTLTAECTYRTSAARVLRKDGKPSEALQLLDSFLPPQPTSLVAGRYSVELGLCYRDLGQPEKALEVLVSAAERVRSLRDNSEVEKYVRELGGVPLDEDRDVDVRYLVNSEGRKIYLGSLTTDGSRLIGAMNNRASRTGFVRAFEPDTETWSTLADQLGQVSSLCVQGDSLWAGTKENGIWRGSLSGSDWKQWTTADGLPDDRVLTLTATETALFASLGTTSAGGVVRIDQNGDIKVFDEKDSPTEAPEHLVVQDNFLLTATRSAFHQLNLESGEWTRINEVPGRGPISVFPGKTNAWTSRYRAELAPFGAGDEEVESFSNGWFKPEPREGASGFLIHFVVDQGDKVWYGGYPWARFRSVGLYRFNRKTREFRMFNLRDGFHMSVTYSMSSGVAIGDDLYVSTAAGLARVTPR